MAQENLLFAQKKQTPCVNCTHGWSLHLQSAMRTMTALLDLLPHFDSPEHHAFATLLKKKQNKQHINLFMHEHRRV